jgi:hypothetical protein
MYRVFLLPPEGVNNEKRKGKKEKSKMTPTGLV